MSDRVRSYMFRGNIDSLQPKTSDYQSDAYLSYVMTGHLRYYGRRHGGGTILVNIEEEPEDANFVYPALPSSGGDDDDENSQAEEEVEQDVQPEAFKTVNLRGVCTLIVVDTGVLVMPHVGMNVNLILHRGALLKQFSNSGKQSDAAHKYRDYEYRVHRLRGWSMPVELRHSHVLSACADIDEIMRVDRARYRASIEAASLGVDRKSAVASGVLGRHGKMYVVADQTNKLIVDSLQHQRRPFTELGGLLSRAGDSLLFRDTVTQAFGNYYALCQSARQGALLITTSVDKALCKLNMSSVVAPHLSMAELDAVFNFYQTHARDEHWLSITFGARPLLPEHALGSRLAAWEGVEWSTFGLASVTNRLVQYIEDTLGELPESVEPLQVLELAYEMHRDQQRPPVWLCKDTIFDVGRLLQWINKKRRLSGGSRGDASGELVGAVVKFMLASGAWMQLPSTTRDRMHRLAQCRNDADGALWLTTAREFAFTRELTRRLLALQPQLVCMEYTHMCMERDDALLYIYCSCVPNQKGGGTNVLQKAVPLYSILSRALYDDNDDWFAVHLLTFRRVVIYDAHFLDSRTLLFLAGLLLRVQQSVGASNLAVELLGVSTLQSVFSQLVASHCFAVSAASATPNVQTNGATAAEYDRVFIEDKKRPLPDRIREFCVQAGTPADVHVGRRALEAALAALPKADLRADILDNKLRRWILVTENRTEAGSMIRGIRRLLQPANKLMQCVMLDRDLALIDAVPSRMTDLVFTCAPFVGYHNRALRVISFMLLRSVPRDATALQEHTVSHLFAGEPGAPDAVSLDCKQLYLELEPMSRQIDHRVCCNTWKPTVLSAARHRLELSSQSFVLAAEALPAAKQPHTLHTTLMFGEKYRFDDVYSALAHACGTSFQRYTVHNLDANVLAQALKWRTPEPRTYLVDMLRMN